MRYRLIFIIFILVSVIGTKSVYATQIEEDTNVYKIIASGCKHDVMDRKLTGFRLIGTPGIITSLHGIADCEVISATSGESTKGMSVYPSMKIDQQDIGRDIAVLQPINESPLSGQIGLVKATTLTKNEDIYTLGYPHGIASQLETKDVRLRRNNFRKLNTLLTPDMVLLFRERNSPKLETDVLSLEGKITHGHSGAPILNMENHVVGIGNGGLEDGKTGIAWAIPINDMTLESSERHNPALDRLRIFNPLPLFFDIREMSSPSSQRKIRFNNDCAQQIQLTMRYRKSSGSWVTRPPVKISANDNLYLQNDDAAKWIADFEIFYYYVELMDGSGLSWGGSNEIWANGRTLPMANDILRLNAEGDLGWTFRCDDIPAPVSTGHNIYFQNNCAHPVRLAMAYHQPSGGWKTDNWWSIDANDNTYLALSNDERIKSNYHIFYFYAESTNGSNLVWEGNAEMALYDRTVMGQKIGLKLDSDRDFVLSISCDSEPRVEEHDLYVVNNCSHPIELALSYWDSSGTWKDEGWWPLDPYEKVTLNDDGTRVSSNYNVFHFYAKSTDGSYLVWEGEFDKVVNGNAVPMQQIELKLDSDGVFVLELDCG